MRSIVFFFLLVGFAGAAKAAHHVKPGKELWATPCTPENINKLLGVDSFQTNDCDFELRDSIVSFRFGEKFRSKFKNAKLGECNEYHQTSDERLQCAKGRFINFALDWNGSEKAFRSSLNKKYGKPIKQIPLYSWRGKDGSDVLEGLGVKRSAGTGYIYENSADRIVYAEAYDNGFTISDRIIYYDPKFLDELKATILHQRATAHKEESGKDRKEEANLPE